MLYHVTHKHREEACPAVYPEQSAMLAVWWQRANEMTDVKIVSCYVSPLDHVFYITIEADDFAAVVRALGPLNAIGSGLTTPVLPVESILQMTGQGAFRQS